MDNILDRVGAFIIRSRKVILPLFLVITVVSVILQSSVTINDDMTKYLPSDSETVIATEIMADEFGNNQSFSVMVVDVDEADIPEYQAIILDVNEGNTVERVSVEAYNDETNDVLFSVTLKEELSLHDAKVAVDDVREALVDKQIAMSGYIVGENYVESIAAGEAVKLMAIIIPALLLILVLTSKSFIEPVISLIAIIASIVIAQGTNVIFEDVSAITNNMFGVLMIAISMDYSVFMLHTFKDARDEGLKSGEAAKYAFKKSFTTISAASMTTMAGFIAFTLMEFTFGADIGWVFAKGILVALLTTTFLVPCLLVAFDKLIIKTSHRDFLPDFTGFGRAVTKIKYFVFPVVFVAIIASSVVANKNDFVYGNSSLVETPGTVLHDDYFLIEETFGHKNQLVVLLPKTETLQEEYDLILKLTAIDHVDAEAIALSTVVYDINPLLLSADLETVYSTLGEENVSELHGDNYSRIVLNLDTKEESEDAFNTVVAVQDLLDAENTDAYVIGGTSAALDMKNSISEDYILVTVVSILAVALIIGLSFKSIILPVFLLLAVQGGVFMNMAIPYVLGEQIPYVAYILIGVIQLGATIDYGILYARKYMEQRKSMAPNEAAAVTTNKVAGSILTSGGVLLAAGLAMFLTSNDAVVSKIGLLLGFGATISVLSVFIFLPSLLIIFDKAVEKTTYEAEFYNK